MEEEERWSAQRKMTWINTQLIVLNLFISVNIILLLVIRPITLRAIGFLVISLVTLTWWYKWKKPIKDLI